MVYSIVYSIDYSIVYIANFHAMHDGRKSRQLQIKFQMKHEIAVGYVQLITKTSQYQYQ